MFSQKWLILYIFHHLENTISISDTLYVYDILNLTQSYKYHLLNKMNIWSQWIALDHVILFWNVWKLRSCLKLPFGTKFWSWKVQFTIVNLNEVDVTHLYFHSGAAAAIYACYCCLLVIHCDIEGVQGGSGGSEGSEGSMASEGPYWVFEVSWMDIH